MSCLPNGFPFLVTPTVFDFYCCITNYHKLKGIKQHPFIMSQFCRSDPGGFIWVSAQGLRLKVLDGWCFYLLALSKNLLPSSFMCWQNPVPYGYRTGFSSLCWSCYQLPETTCHFYHVVLSIIEPAMENFLHVLYSASNLFLQKESPSF